MTIIAAADGSALGNPGPAGWAWYVDEGCWAAGGWPSATNNRGELTAVLELLHATRAAGLAGEDLSPAGSATRGARSQAGGGRTRLASHLAACP